MAKPRAKKGKGGAGGFKRGVATVGKGKKEKRAEMAEIIQQILATTGKAKAKEKKKAKPSAQGIEEIEGAKAEAVIEEVMLEEKGETEAGALETPTSQEPAEERGGFAEAGWTEPKEQMIEQSRAGKRSRGKEKTMKITESAEIESGAMPLKVIAPEVAKERITVKPIPRIVSGIPGLDEMTDGGLEAKSITLVNGDPGSGKTILGLQFLHAGAKRGEAGLYISFGEPREVLYPRMMAFGMNLQDLEDKKLLFVVEYQPHEIAKIMQEEGGTIYDIVMAYNVKRIVVDPVTPYLVQFENPYDARLALVRLTNVVRKWNATVLLMNEVSEKAPPSPATTISEFFTDGVINLIHRRTEEGIQLRGIEIWKMYGVAHMEVARPFAFTKRGIVVYPTERLFAKSR